MPACMHRPLATMARSAVTHLLFAIAMVAIGWLLIGFGPMPALPAQPLTTGTISGPDGEFTIPGLPLDCARPGTR